MRYAGLSACCSQANALIEYVMTCQTVRIGLSSDDDDYPHQMTLDDLIPGALGDGTFGEACGGYPYDIF